MQVGAADDATPPRPFAQLAPLQSYTRRPLAVFPRSSTSSAAPRRARAARAIWSDGDPDTALGDCVRRSATTISSPSCSSAIAAPDRPFPPRRQRRASLERDDQAQAPVAALVGSRTCETSAATCCVSGARLREAGADPDLAGARRPEVVEGYLGQSGCFVRATGELWSSRSICGPTLTWCRTRMGTLSAAGR